MTDAPRLSRRRFLHLAGTLAGGMLLGACKSLPRAGSRRADQQPVQLVYQDWRTPWFPPMAQRMLEAFHETYPGIRVFFVPDPEDFDAKMLADFQAGTAPDVFQGCCVHFPTWAQKGYTLDLGPYVRDHLDRTTIDEWNQAQYRSFFLRDGVQYGLPKYHGALALYYNKDLLDAYGVEVPGGDWDHDDYLAAMVDLARDRDEDGQRDLWGSLLDVSWDRIQMHVNGWGGHLVDPEDPSRCLMDHPEAMAAMEWLRARMWDDRVMATSLDVQNMGTRQAFIAQKVAMVEDGSWALKDILTGADFRLGVAPFPAGPARRVTLATTDGFGIYAGTRHPEAAWELLEFLTGQDYGRAMAQDGFLQPARASLVEEWVRLVRDQFPEEAADVDIAAFADGHVKGYSVTGEIAANMAEVKRITYEAWEEIFTLGRAPVERMAEVCRRIHEAQRTAGQPPGGLQRLWRRLGGIKENP